MARKDIEWGHQKALCDWAKLQRLDIGFTVFDLLIAIKNESYEKTDPKKPWQAGKRINRYKESGMKSGTPDLLFAYPCHGEHGLWIEMKKPGGKVRDNQVDMQQRLRFAGYRVYTCYSWEEAKDTILKYLAGEL